MRADWHRKNRRVCAADSANADNTRRCEARAAKWRASRDPLLRLKLPADGVYTVTLMDAHNQGGPTHPYLLHVRRED